MVINVLPAVGPICTTTVPALFNMPRPYKAAELSCVLTSYSTCVVVTGKVSTIPQSVS